MTVHEVSKGQPIHHSLYNDMVDAIGGADGFSSSQGGQGLLRATITSEDLDTITCDPGGIIAAKRSGDRGRTVYSVGDETLVALNVFNGGGVPGVAHADAGSRGGDGSAPTGFTYNIVIEPQPFYLFRPQPGDPRLPPLGIRPSSHYTRTDPFNFGFFANYLGDRLISGDQRAQMGAYFATVDPTDDVVTGNKFRAFESMLDSPGGLAWFDNYQEWNELESVPWMGIIGPLGRGSAFDSFEPSTPPVDSVATSLVPEMKNWDPFSGPYFARRLALVFELPFEMRFGNAYSIQWRGRAFDPNVADGPFPTFWDPVFQVHRENFQAYYKCDVRTGNVPGEGDYLGTCYESYIRYDNFDGSIRDVSPSVMENAGSFIDQFWHFDT